jgi:hypothetical protein
LGVQGVGVGVRGRAGRGVGVVEGAGHLRVEPAHHRREHGRGVRLPSPRVMASGLGRRLPPLVITRRRGGLLSALHYPGGAGTVLGRARCRGRGCGKRWCGARPRGRAILWRRGLLRGSAHGRGGRAGQPLRRWLQRGLRRGSVAPRRCARMGELGRRRRRRWRQRRRLPMLLRLGPRVEKRQWVPSRRHGPN